MSYIIIHDQRVNIPTPAGDKQIRINASSNLASALEEASNFLNHDIGSTVKSNNELHLLCHGLPQGLQLGSTFIHHNNISMFSILASKIGLISIHGCNAACDYPNACHGALMCRRLAFITRSFVYAADSVQYATNGASIAARNGSEFAPWQGNVGTFDPHGRLVNTTFYPVQNQ